MHADIAALKAAAAIRRAQVAGVVIPPPSPSRRLLRIMPGEVWCTQCGEAGDGDRGFRCGSRLIQPAIGILRPGEYCIAG